MLYSIPEGSTHEARMIVKRSGRNQVAIPKRLIAEAGLSGEDVFFDIRYARGCFVLTPVQFEEKISKEALERMKTRALRTEPGDRSFSSMEELARGLDRKHRSK